MKKRYLALMVVPTLAFVVAYAAGRHSRKRPVYDIEHAGLTGPCVIHQKELEVHGLRGLGARAEAAVYRVVVERSGPCRGLRESRAGLDPRGRSAMYKSRLYRNGRLFEARPVLSVRAFNGRKYALE